MKYDNRKVQTFTICLQPEDIEKLKEVDIYYLGNTGEQVSRSRLIAYCISVCHEAFRLLEEYKNEIKE